MSDAVELLLVSLAVALGATAFALGAQLVRVAWRDASEVPDPAGAPPAEPVEPTLALRGIAAFEALKALVALVVAGGLVALAAHPDGFSASSAIVSGLRQVLDALHASRALAHGLAAEHGPWLLGVAGYTGLHLAEAWGLWHLRPWGDALGVASGCVDLSFELGPLLNGPGWTGSARLALNLAVISYLLRRLQRRSKRIRHAGGPSRPRP